MLAGPIEFIGYYWEALQLMGTGDAHWELK